MKHGRDGELGRGRTGAKNRHERTPQRIGELLGRLLARRGYAHAQSAALSESAWRGAVGDALAFDSRPGRIRKGVLEISVRNSAVLQELTFRKKQLLAEMQRRMANTAVKDLRFFIRALD